MNREMTRAEFDVAYYGAAGAYTADTGGGSLEGLGYDEIAGAVWVKPSTGFKARAYTDQNGNYLLAFAGTDDLADTYQNLDNLGRDQWNIEKQEIELFFKDIDDDKGINSITFTGHSLGGALAQYAAYDFVADGIIEPEKINLTTFNGLGGVTGLEKEYKSAYDSDLLNSANIHNYHEPSDLVVMLSEHVGGQESNFKLISTNVTQDFLYAHSMDTIHAHMQLDGIFELNLQSNLEYFDLDDSLPMLQELSGAANGFIYGGADDVSSTEAVARIVAVLSVIPKMTLYPPAKAEYDKLTDWIFNNIAEATWGYTEESDRAVIVDVMKSALSVAEKLVGNFEKGLVFGAVTISLISEITEYLTSDGNLTAPANDLLMHSMLNVMSGATPDQFGVYDNGLITEQEATNILNAAARNEDDRYKNLIEPISKLYRLQVEEGLYGAITLHKHITTLDNFVAVVDSTSLTEDEFQTLVSQDSLDGLIARYLILNNASFIPIGSFDSTEIDSSILESEKYSLGAYSESYWADRYDYYMTILKENSNNALFQGNGSGETAFYTDLESGRNTTFIGQGDAIYATFGSGDRDSLIGTEESERVYGAGGNDFINGEAGNDYLEGNKGDDILLGGTGKDILDGGDGRDTLYAQDNVDRSDESLDTLIGGKGVDNLYGDDGVDFLIGSNASLEGERNTIRAFVDDKERDILSGGKGYDFYIAGDNDVIKDVGEGFINAGSGRIYLQYDSISENERVTRNGYTLESGYFLARGGSRTKRPDTHFVNDVWIGGKGESLVRSEDDLIINFDDGKEVLIDDYFNHAWKDSNGTYFGYLGITLRTRYLPAVQDEQEPEPDAEPAPELPPSPVRPIPRQPTPPSTRIVDPLSLDLNKDGMISTIPLEEGVYFDLDNSDLAEKISWVAPEDGLLTLDLNGNGIIEGGAELFGDQTLMPNGENAPNGFVALGQYDSNLDGKISAEDEIFSNLKIWQDLNSDGISNVEELSTLNQNDIVEISLNYEVAPYIDDNDVLHQELASYTDGESETYSAETLWFQSDAEDTIPVTEHLGEGIEIPESVKHLPDLKGYGNVFSLQQAMALDTSGELAALVDRFTWERDDSERRALVSEILDLWTNTKDIDPSSRGPNVDAGHLAILEAFWGQEIQLEPDAGYGIRLMAAYEELERSTYIQLMIDSYYPVEFNMLNFTETEAGWEADYTSLAKEFVHRFENGFPEVEAFYSSFLHFMKDLEPNNASYADQLETEIKSEAISAAINGEEQLLSYLRQGDSVLNGTDEDDVLWGYGGEDTINGSKGNDDLAGGAENDELSGGQGNDLYRFGFGDGQDIVRDQGGLLENTDTLRFSEGVLPEHVTVILEQSGTEYNLKFILTHPYDESLNSSIIIESHRSNLVNQIEIVSFESSELVWIWEDLQAMHNYEFNSENNDILGHGGDDNLDALAGDDTVRGLAGNDTIRGSDGFDTIYGGTGGDTLYGDQGDDTLHGEDGIDRLYGGVGEDYLYGGEGKDTLDGGADSDDLFGEAGDDTLQGGLGEDDLRGGSGKDKLYGGDDNDNLYGDTDNDELYGGAGDDSLYGGGGDDELYAGAGDDKRVFGGAGNDTIDGGSGDDRLSAGLGDDIYIFGEGRGHDVIANYYQVGFDKGNADNYQLDTDKIKLVGGLTVSDVEFSRAENNDPYAYKTHDDLLITVKASRETLRVVNFFSLTYDDTKSSDNIDLIEFDDGTSLTPLEIYNLLNDATTEGDDYLVLSDEVIPSTTGLLAGDDVLYGSQGADTVQGGDGEDTVFGRNGNDVIHGGEHDDDLYGQEGNDQLFGGSGNDWLDGGNGSDILAGGTGDDRVRSSGEGNTIIYNSGDGHDHLYLASNANNILQLSDDIALSDIEIRHTGYGSVHISFGDWYHDSITTGAQGIDRILGNGFELSGLSASGAYMDLEWSTSHLPGVNEDDGDRTGHFTTWIVRNSDTWEIVDAWSEVRGTSQSDLIYARNGYAKESRIYGEGGDDFLIGRIGDEKIYGGDGHDILKGGRGNDLLVGGSGDDTYLVEEEIGTVRIADDAEDFNIIKIGSSLLVSDASLTQSESDLLISFTQGKEVLVANYFDSENHEGVIDEIHFADGTVWDQQYITVSVQGDNTDIPGDYVEGTADPETLYGTSGNDWIEGYEGDDVLHGEDGDDVLVGGTGNDTLYGGAGDDDYDFHPGFGQDTIYNTGGDYNEIWLYERSESDVEYFRQGNDLVVSIVGSTDQITVKGWYESVEHKVVVFFDASTTTHSIEYIESVVTDEGETSNNNPVALEDTESVLEDSSVTIDVLSNDSDVDGDVLSVDSATATNGSVTINGDGTLTYTPNVDFNGVDTISYDVADGQGGSASSTVFVTVTADNDEPDAVADTAITQEETAVTIDVLANDSDVDSDVLSVDSATATNGSVTINADGTLTYTPNVDFNGVDTISYDISDSQGGSASSMVSVTVTPTEVEPEPSSETVVHRVNVGGALLTAIDGGLDWAADTNATPSAYLLDAGSGYVGTSDVGGVDATVNQAEVPLALFDTRRSDTAGETEIHYGFDVSEAGLYEVRYYAVDSWYGSQYAGERVVDIELEGIVTADFENLDLSGTFGGSQAGMFSAQVEVTDGVLDMRFLHDVANPTVSGIEIVYLGGNDDNTSSNNSPIALNDTSTTEEETMVVINVLGNDSDPDNDSLSVTFASAENGSVTINGDGTLTYTPYAEFNGVDTISYDIADGQGGSASSTVSVTVTTDNDEPVAVVDTAVTQEENAVTIDVLANDTDVDGDVLTVESATAINGSVTINGDGTLTYTPNVDFNGVDTISYDIADGQGGSASSTVSVTVEAAEQDVSEVVVHRVNIGGGQLAAIDGGLDWSADTNATPSAYLLDAGSGYVGTSDVGGVDASVNQAEVPLALFGTRRSDTAGETEIHYGFNVSEAGLYEVRYYGVDSWYGSQYAGERVVDIELEGTVTADFENLDLSGTFGGSIAGMFSTQVEVTDGVLDMRFIHDVANPTVSGIEILRIGDSGSTGGTDDSGSSNEGPTAIADVAEVLEDASVMINVLGNDTDPEGDTLTIDSASAVEGEVTINADGTLSYMPDPDFNGEDTITYHIVDGNGGAASATVTVTVKPENDDPVALADTASTQEGMGVVIDVLNNDNDIDGDDLVVDQATAPNGSVTINNDGTLNYVPYAGFVGTDTITYTINDGNDGSDVADVTVTVTAPPEPSTETVIHRVNVGGNQLAAIDEGPDWAADTNISPSVYLLDSGSGYVGSSTVSGVDASVNQSEVPLALFQTRRSDVSGGTEIHYGFDVAEAGMYEVRYFGIDSWYGSQSAGQRVVDIELEGNIPTDFEDLDLSGTFGGSHAGMFSSRVEVSDGVLDVRFLHDVANPTVSGIEILHIDVEQLVSSMASFGASSEGIISSSQDEPTQVNLAVAA